MGWAVGTGTGDVARCRKGVAGGGGGRADGWVLVWVPV